MVMRVQQKLKCAYVCTGHSVLLRRAVLPRCVAHKNGERADNAKKANHI